MRLFLIKKEKKQIVFNWNKAPICVRHSNSLTSKTLLWSSFFVAMRNSETSLFPEILYDEFSSQHFWYTLLLPWRERERKAVSETVCVSCWTEKPLFWCDLSSSGCILILFCFVWFLPFASLFNRKMFGKKVSWYELTILIYMMKKKEFEKIVPNCVFYV